MGCGGMGKSQQTEGEAQPKLKLNQKQQQNTQQQSSSESQFLYIFGQYQNSQFPSNDKEFKQNNISNKDSHFIPVIIQFDAESQIFTKKTVPANLQLFLFSQATLIEDMVFITGGVSPQLDLITDQCFQYFPFKNVSFQIPQMLTSRFAHIQIMWKDKLFVFGGRSNISDANQILSDCESFSFQDNQWSQLAPMKYERCAGNALIYKTNIYVFGGVNMNMRRTRKIERYIIKINQWDLINVKLFQGVDSGLVFPGEAPNEFLIVGGQLRAGPVASCLCYNLALGTVIQHANMQAKRALHKGLRWQNRLFVFCGDNSSQLETLDLLNFNISEVESALQNKWIDATNLEQSFTNFVPSASLEYFASSSVSTIVQNKDQKMEKSKVFKDEIVILFGTDQHPGLTCFNITQATVSLKSIPCDMRLLCYQGGARITSEDYFLCGGITFQMDLISKKAFVYKASLQKIVKLPNMRNERYAFGCIYVKPFVYAVGGRTYGDDERAIMRQCERFDFNTYMNGNAQAGTQEEQEWQSIADLNQPRCQFGLFAMRDSICVAGGYEGKGKRLNTLEFYDVKENVWLLLQVELPACLESISATAVTQNQILFLGGRGEDGIDSHNVFQLIFYEGVSKAKLLEESTKLQQSVSSCLKTYRLQSKPECIMLLSKPDLKAEDIDQANYIELFNIKSKQIQAPSEYQFIIQQMNILVKKLIDQDFDFGKSLFL